MATLVIRFDYAPQPRAPSRKALVDQAVAGGSGRMRRSRRAGWTLTTRAPTEKNPKRTLLEKHLTTYTQKNTADYFIHKDLGGFLRRELDFYIKNEVMNLDDVQGAEAFAAIESQPADDPVPARHCAGSDHLPRQHRDFQKKLWLKRNSSWRRIIASRWTDRVPEPLRRMIGSQPTLRNGRNGMNSACATAHSAGTIEDLQAQPYPDGGYRAV
jgi:adenine-specific DNA-methyltransferase